MAGTTHDETRAAVARRRLAAFLENARLNARARLGQTEDGGMYLVVVDLGLAREDYATLPREVDGLEVAVTREGR